jgi:selenocysteine-specific elongation factor
VHTMVAGASGIDFALLVVAADDGIMPQTREHLAILELLGIARGAVALTKADRVEAERIEQVKADINALLGVTPLAGAPIFPVNATAPDDPGTHTLGEALREAAAARFGARPREQLFRLAVDRVFSLPGHGTVAAGTVFAGQVRPGEVVHVMPRGTPVRVRSLHAQNRPAEVGSAGERCALNLAGLETSAVARGDWLAAKELLAPTLRIDVRLKLLTRSPLRHLISWSPLHVHLGTTHRVVHVVLLESDELLPGQSSLVQLVFDKPICAMPGDRFIVRDAQAAHTVGGGVVLDPFAPPRMRRSGDRRRRLDALEKLIATSDLAAVLDEAAHGLTLSELVRLTGLPAGQLTLPSDTLTINSEHERFVVQASHWSALRERALGTLEVFHRDIPDEPGAAVGRLRRMAAPQLPEVLWRALIQELVSEQLVMRKGPWLHRPGHSVTLAAQDEALAGKLKALIAAGRFDPPWVRDLAALAHEPEQRVREVLRKVVTQGSVYQVVHDLFYDRDCVAELAAILSQLAEEHGAVSAARYRDAVGLGRKRAIQILEFFDRIGYTRRVRDQHVLRPDSGWGSS